MEWYLMVWKKYAEFDGRARRKEYWMFTLVNVIAIMLLSGLAVAGMVLSRDTGPFLFIPMGIYALAALIPGHFRRDAPVPRHRQERLDALVALRAWHYPRRGIHLRNHSDRPLVPGQPARSEPVRAQSEVSRAGSDDVCRKCGLRSGEYSPRRRNHSLAEINPGICKSCGAKLADGAPFCTQCGTHV